MHARALIVARMRGAYFRTTLSSCSLRSNDVWKYAPTINCGGLELPVGFRSMTMFLVEQTTVPVASLPVSQFKHHLQLGTGFADDTAQDAVLEQYLRAAIAAIEARTGKVILSKQFRWSLTAWRDASRQPLPMAPVISLDIVRLVDRMGSQTIIDDTTYQLQPDQHRPAIAAMGGCLPTVPMGSTVEIDLTAGYGPDWDDVPASLQQGIMILAASYYEDRAGNARKGDLPFAVSGLIERFRSIRILGGRAK